MIENGFRLYLREDGTLGLAAIMDGKIVELEPSPDDWAKPLGYYEPTGVLVEPDAPVNMAEVARAWGVDTGGQD